MFCRKCGTYLPDSVRFCTTCGQPAVPPVAPQPYPVYYQTPAKPLKKNKKTLATVLIVLAVLLVAIPTIIFSIQLIKELSGGGSTDPTTHGSGQTDAVSTTVDSGDGFRSNYTTILGDGADTCTVMIYICGADLESEGGCATTDIEEMLAADFGDNVNVVLQTGGCYNWSMDGIADGEVQRWQVKDGQLVKLQDLGQISMLETSALGDFISYATDNFPANRNALVFWDHGGGSLYGFGSDELFPGSCLYLSDIASALSGSGMKFDMVGFDACLMGSIETAYMLEPYADYLVASEETEPSYGWDYTPWLTALGKNTSIDTVALGAEIVDSFILQNSADSTLSVVALREIPYVYNVLCDYMANAATDIAEQEFNVISAAVSNTKSFAEGGYDMIDIVDFTNQSEIAGESDLVAALGSAVKYRNDCTNSGVYGLSLYFPYTDISVYDYAKQTFADFGFGDEVYVFYDSFVNILAGGQTNSNSRSLQENLTGEVDAATDYSAFGWYDSNTVENYDYDSIDYTELETFWDDANGYYYLPLTEQDWDLITAVEMQILLDDGEGYIDLGSDQYYETDDAGNLILNYGSDNTWVAIGGQIVCYYAEAIIESETGSAFIGYVPAELNGTTDIEIILQWDGEDADGYIAGYRLADSNSAIGEDGTLGKGYLPLYQGDVINFVCDYYTYDGNFDANYYFGESITIGEFLPEVTYEDVGESTVLECYMIVDIYQNYAWTETIEFSN